MIHKYKCPECLHTWLVSADDPSYISFDDEVCSKCLTKGNLMSTAR